MSFIKSCLKYRSFCSTQKEGIGSGDHLFPGTSRFALSVSGRLDSPSSFSPAMTFRIASKSGADSFARLTTCTLTGSPSVFGRRASNSFVAAATSILAPLGSARRRIGIRIALDSSVKHYLPSPIWTGTDPNRHSADASHSDLNCATDGLHATRAAGGIRSGLYVVYMR